MNSVKGNLCIKVISVLVIIAFLTLDVAWAYPPDSSGQYKLSGQSVFQPKLMNPDDPLATRYKETILYDAKATNTVFNIVKFLWGDPEEGVTPKPLNYMKETLTAELGPNPAGINLSQVRPKGDVPENGIISPDEVLLIPGVRGDAKFIIQVARKDTLSAKELIGYKWLISDISDEYVAKIVTEGYVEEPATPAAVAPAEAKEPEVEISEPVAEIDAEIVKTEPEREAPSKRKLIIRAIVGAAVLLLAVMPSAFGATTPIAGTGALASMAFPELSSNETIALIAAGALFIGYIVHLLFFKKDLKKIRMFTEFSEDEYTEFRHRASDAENWLEHKDPKWLRRKLGKDYERILRPYVLIKKGEWKKVVELGDTAITALYVAVITEGNQQALEALGEIGSPSALNILCGIVAGSDKMLDLLDAPAGITWRFKNNTRKKAAEVLDNVAGLLDPEKRQELLKLGVRNRIEEVMGPDALRKRLEDGFNSKYSPAGLKVLRKLNLRTAPWKFKCRNPLAVLFDAMPADEGKNYFYPFRVVGLEPSEIDELSTMLMQRTRSFTDIDEVNDILSRVFGSYKNIVESTETESNIGHLGTHEVPGIRYTSWDVDIPAGTVFLLEEHQVTCDFGRLEKILQAEGKRKSKLKDEGEGQAEDGPQTPDEPSTGPSLKSIILLAAVGILAISSSAFAAPSGDIFLGMPIDWNTVFMGLGVYLLGSVNSVITFLGTEKITDEHSIRKKYVELLLWPGSNFLFKGPVIIRVLATAVILPLMGLLTLPLTLLDILKVILVRIPKKFLTIMAEKEDSYIAPRKEPRTHGAGAVYRTAKRRILGKDYRGAKPKVEVAKSPKKEAEEIKPHTLVSFLKWMRDRNWRKMAAEKKAKRKEAAAKRKAEKDAAKAKRKAEKDAAAAAKKAEKETAATAKAKPIEEAKPDRVKMKAKAKTKTKGKEAAKPAGKKQPEGGGKPGPKSPAEEAVAKLKSLQPKEMKAFFDIQRQSMYGGDDWIGFLAGALYEEEKRIKGGRQLSPVHESIVKDLGSIGLRRSADQAVYARIKLTFESHIRRINEYLKQKKERPSPGKPTGTIKTSSHGVSRQMAMEQLLAIYLNAEEGVKLGREHEVLISGEATRAVFMSEALRSADSIEVVLKPISEEIISEMGTQRVRPPKKGPEPGSGPSAKGFLTGGILLALAASLGAGCTEVAKNSSSWKVFAILAVISVVFYAVFGRSQLVSGGMGSGDAEEADKEDPRVDEAVLTQIDEAKARVRDTQRELIQALRARKEREGRGEEEEPEEEKTEEEDEDANDLLADVVERKEVFEEACRQARELIEDFVVIGLAGEDEIDAAIADARIEIRNAIDGEPIVLTKDEQDELEAEEAAKEAEEAVDHAVIHLELAADRVIRLTKASVKDEEEIQRAREAFERAWKAARELSRNISDELMQEVERAIRNNRARVNSARRRTDRAHDFIARSGNRAAWIASIPYFLSVAGLIFAIWNQSGTATFAVFAAGIVISGTAALRYFGVSEKIQAQMEEYLTNRFAVLDRPTDIAVRAAMIMDEASLPQKERERIFRLIRKYQDRKDFKKILITHLALVIPVARHDGYRHLVFERLPEDTQRLINIHEAYKSHFWGMVKMLPVISLSNLRDRQLTQKEVEDLVKARLNRIKVPDRRLDKDVLISEGDISSTAERIRSISKKKSDIKELLPKLIREVEICYPEPREVVRKEVTSGPTDQWSMEVERKEMVDGAIVVFFDNNSFVLLRNNTQWAKAHLPPSMASDYIQKIYKDIERVEIAVERKAEIYSDLFHSRIDKVIKSYDMRFLVFFLENILDHPCERIRNSAKAVLKIIGNPEAPNPDATEVAECFMRAQERLKQYKDFPRVVLVDLTKNFLAARESLKESLELEGDTPSDKELDVFVDIIKSKIKKTIHKEIGGSDHTEIEFVHTAYDYSKVAELAGNVENLRALFKSGMTVPAVERDVQPDEKKGPAHDFIAKSGNRAAWLMGALYVASVAGLLLCLAAQTKIPTMIAFAAGIILSGWAALRYLGLREHVRAEMKDFLTYRLAGLDRVGDIMVRTGLIMQEASLPQKEREKVFRFIKEYQDRKDFKKRLIEYLAPVFPVARHDGYRHLVFERLPEDTQRLINIHEAYKSHFWGMVMVLPVVSLFSFRDRQLTQKEVEAMVESRVYKIRDPYGRLFKDVLILEGYEWQRKLKKYDGTRIAEKIRSVSKMRSDIKELLPKFIRAVEVRYPEPRKIVRERRGGTDQLEMIFKREEMVDEAAVVYFDHLTYKAAGQSREADPERDKKEALLYERLYNFEMEEIVRSAETGDLAFPLKEMLDHPCENIRSSAEAALKIIGTDETPGPDASGVAKVVLHVWEKLRGESLLEPEYKDFPRVALVDLTKNLLAIKKSSSSVASTAADMLGVVFLSDKELDVFVDIIKSKIKKTIHKEIGGGDHTELEFVHTAYDYSEVTELAGNVEKLRALFKSGMAVPVVARDVQPETPAPVEAHPAEARPAEAHPVEALPLFLKLEGYINNHRDRLVDEANKIITYLSEKDRIKRLLIVNSRSTAEIVDQMEKALADMEKLQESGEQIEIPEEVASAIETVKNNLNLFEAEGVIAAIILLARKAERNGKNLVIGLETDWIPGLEKGNLQHNAVSPLLNMIESLQDELRSLGLKNVTIVHKKADELADAVLAEAMDKSETILNADFSNVVILASRETINSRVFSVFKNVEKNAFLAEVDARELKEAYEENGEAFDKQITARITEMFCLALELASGKMEPMFDIPWLGIDYNEALRIVTFLPKAEPEDYDKLQEKYKNKILALRAA